MPSKVVLKVLHFKVSDMNNIGNEYEMRNANHYVSNEQIERKMEANKRCASDYLLKLAQQ